MLIHLPACLSFISLPSVYVILFMSRVPFLPSFHSSLDLSCVFIAWCQYWCRVVVVVVVCPPLPPPSLLLLPFTCVPRSHFTPPLSLSITSLWGFYCALPSSSYSSTPPPPLSPYTCSYLLPFPQTQSSSSSPSFLFSLSLPVHSPFSYFSLILFVSSSFRASDLLLLL